MIPRLAGWSVVLLSSCAGEVEGDLVPEDGCTLDDARFTRVAVGAAEAEAVLRATWTTTEPSVGRVVFTDGDGVRETPPEPGPTTDHEALLLGIPAGSDVALRLVDEGDGDAVCSDRIETTTPLPPADLPVVERIGDVPSDPPPYLVFVPLLEESTATWIVALDGLGRYVWWLQPGGTFFWAGFTADWSALLLVNGAAGADSVGTLLEIAFDGTILSETTFPGIHNQAIELPDGRYAVLGREVYTATVLDQTREFTSDVLWLLDREGGATRLWSAYEALPGAIEAIVPRLPDWEDPDALVDWCHGTSLAHDPDKGRILVTLTALHALVAVDLDTGDHLWTLGSVVSDFPPPSDGSPAPVDFPHSVQVAAEGRIVTYEEVAVRDRVPCGESREIEVEPDVPQAGIAWWARTPDCDWSPTLGSAWRTDDGSTLSSGGSLGRFDWFDEAGAWTTGFSLPAGYTLGGAIPVSLSD